MHPIIRPIPDSIVHPSEFLKRSMATLPKGMEIRASDIENAGLGVFAVKKFTNGATFGPYLGEKLKPSIPRIGLDTSYIWEVSINIMTRPNPVCPMSKALERSPFIKG